MDWTHTNVHARMHAPTYTHAHAHTHTHTQTHTHPQTHTHTHTDVSTETILRNKACGGLWMVCAWFENT